MIMRIRGRRFPIPRPAAVVPALLLAALLASAVPAAAAGESSFSLGYGTGLLMRGDWGNGFQAAFLLNLWRQTGAFISTDLVSGSAAFSSGGGVIVDAGFWKAFSSGSSRPIALIGFSFSTGDAKEADLGGFGMHFGFRQEFYFGKHFGVYGRALLRIWLTADEMDAVSPAIGGGAVYRF